MAASVHCDCSESIRGSRPKLSTSHSISLGVDRDKPEQRKSDVVLTSIRSNSITLTIDSVRPVALTMDSNWALSAHGFSLKNLSRKSSCSLEKSKREKEKTLRITGRRHITKGINRCHVTGWLMICLRRRNLLPLWWFVRDDDERCLALEYSYWAWFNKLWIL